VANFNIIRSKSANSFTSEANYNHEWSTHYFTSYFYPEDGGSRFLPNVGKLLQDYTASYTKIQPSKTDRYVTETKKKLNSFKISANK